MTFWRIKNPNYESDYQNSYINGSLKHPFGLPGVKCDVCGETSSGIRILAFECPDSFRSHKNIINGWPISRSKHEKLQQEIMDALQINGVSFIELRPGDDFQPCFLDVPSRPCADFLWSSLGSLVVSERIKNFLIDFCSDDIDVCPVTLRKIGKWEAKLPPLIPSTGEPGDIINEVAILTNNSEIDPYYEIIILKESKYPPGGTPINICSGCKRPTIDKSTRELRMTPDMWKGSDIFFLATTLQIVITDELRTQLESLNPTNVIFEKV